MQDHGPRRASTISHDLTQEVVEEQQQEAAFRCVLRGLSVPYLKLTRRPCFATLSDLAHMRPYVLTQHPNFCSPTLETDTWAPLALVKNTTVQPRRILQRRRMRMPPQQGLLHDQLPLLAVRLPSTSPGLQLQGKGNGQVSDEVVQVLPGW